MGVTLEDHDDEVDRGRANKPALPPNLKLMIECESRDCPHCQAKCGEKLSDYDCPECEKGFCSRCFISMPELDGSVAKCPHCEVVLRFPPRQIQNE